MSVLTSPVKIIRESEGLTQSDAATRLGISLRNYQRIENGTYPIPDHVAYLIILGALHEDRLKSLQSTQFFQECVKFNQSIESK